MYILLRTRFTDQKLITFCSCEDIVAPVDGFVANPHLRDIAKRFGMRESRVKSMMFRTRNKLRDYLEAEGVIL